MFSQKCKQLYRQRIKHYKKLGKDVVKKVEADFKNSYKEISNYNDQGVLNSETVDLNKNLNRVVLNTKFDADRIIADGKRNSVTNESVNINGNVVRIVNTEHSDGVESSFLDGNVEQLTTNSGNVQTVTRDEDGDLIADNPAVEDVLKRIGIENVDDIYAACNEIDEKAEEREEEEELEEEYPEPSLNRTDS